MLRGDRGVWDDGWSSRRARRPRTRWLLRSLSRKRISLRTWPLGASLRRNEGQGDGLQSTPHTFALPPLKFHHPADRRKRRDETRRPPWSCKSCGREQQLFRAPNETGQRLPNAPDMEIFSMNGVGFPTERAYSYKLTTSSECYIPFQIDTYAEDGSEDSCLHGGVYLVNGDETVPVLSAGYMTAKAWHGRTHFNPFGIKTYNREFSHAPPSNLLEGRGTQSGAHVDMMGNFALIKDIIKVAAGATGENLGGDHVYSDILEWSEKINLHL